MNISNLLKSAFVSLLGAGVLASCSKDNAITPTKPSLRSEISYSVLTSDTISYKRLFKNSNGDSTVDRTEGRNINNMIFGLNSYQSSNISGNTKIDSTILANMYFGNGFTGTFTGTTAAALNASGQSLKAITAISRANSAEKDAIVNKFLSYFGKMAYTSQFANQTATVTVAGKAFNGTTGYLVDEKGLEWIQIIQKSLIGVQLDYIGNYLLKSSRLASLENYTTVTGKNYTELEHNWDIAYGVLTLKERYAGAATLTSNGGERYLGAYLWEYNKEGYTKIHPAFLKGRIAIVRNDQTTLQEQANIIRKEMELAIANSAIGYLIKFRNAGGNDGVGTHAIGEGLGFIYALRFCNYYGGTDAFSDDILNNLIYNSPKGYWDLTNAKANAAIASIQKQFGLN